MVFYYYYIDYILKNLKIHKSFSQFRSRICILSTGNARQNQYQAHFDFDDHYCNRSNTYIKNL